MRVRVEVHKSVTREWYWLCPDPLCECDGVGFHPTQHEAMTAAAEHIRTHHRGES